MKMVISGQQLSLAQTECIAFFMSDCGELPPEIQRLLADQVQHFNLIAQKQQFTGKKKQICIIPLILDAKVVYVAACGTGALNNGLSIEEYRRTVGSLYRKLTSCKITHATLLIPDELLPGTTSSIILYETALTLKLAAYHFDDYITDESRKEKLINFTIHTPVDQSTATQAIEKGILVGNAVNRARHWIDLPPIVLTPPDLASKAKKIAEEYNLHCTVFHEKEINEMGMGGLSAVSRGSELDCALSILEYRVKNVDAPTLVLVGKGITFDSGGLSIKPANSMETMKDDMAGAAAVIATMQVIAQLKPNINVIGITPLAENLPSGKAIKPGDIVHFYNGKTAEIKNTDAEGRLILADALSYAVKQYKPDAIIDIATLTGAVAYALGPFYSGVMSHNDLLVDALQQAALRSGDRIWRLPLDEDYRPAIKTEAADLSNIGSPKYMAGTITAALFLEQFVNDVPWAHLDIAGTAFNVPDISYYRSGATGVGVRLLADLVMNWPTKK